MVLKALKPSKGGKGQKGNAKKKWSQKRKDHVVPGACRTFRMVPEQLHPGLAKLSLDKRGREGREDVVCALHC